MRIVLFFVLFSSALSGQKISHQQHVELGDVHWYREYDDAFAKAKKEDKSVLILFQEVPGCSTCKNYGQNVLTHPLIVEGIETEFIPLCIFNNKKGKDLDILQKFNEPTWNNPVVRIFDKNQKELTPRLSGNYSSAGLISSINSALIKSNSLIPEYLNLLEQELSSETDEIFLSMYCFWTGEKEIANIAGVIGTEAGFMNGKEVVKVRFNQSVTSAKSIHKIAKKSSCGDQMFDKNNNYRKDKESKYYLRHSSLKYLPMTPLQESKTNRALALKEDPLKYLSPTQREYLKVINKSPKKPWEVYLETDFETSYRNFKAFILQ